MVPLKTLTILLNGTNGTLTTQESNFHGRVVLRKQAAPEFSFAGNLGFFYLFGPKINISTL